MVLKFQIKFSFLLCLLYFFTSPASAVDCENYGNIQFDNAYGYKISKIILSSNATNTYKYPNDKCREKTTLSNSQKVLVTNTSGDFSSISYQDTSKNKMVYTWVKTNSLQSDCDVSDKIERTRITLDENLLKVINKKRAFFYSNPENRCKMKELFLVKGDVVQSLGTLGDFVLVMYNRFNDAGDYIVIKWMKKSDLSVITPSYTTPKSKLTFEDFIISDGKIKINVNNSIEYLLTQGDWLKNNLKQCTDANYFVRLHWGEGQNIIETTTSREKDSIMSDVIPNIEGCADSYLEANGLHNRIYHINLKDSTFSTHRGIKVGDSLEDLQASYDQVIVKPGDDNELPHVILSHEGHLLIFYLNNDNSISEISLYGWERPHTPGFSMHTQFLKPLV